MLPPLLHAFNLWSSTAERDHDGWESTFPHWQALITAAADAMLALSQGDSAPTPTDLSDLARVWSLSNETEDLADIVRANPGRFAPALAPLYAIADRDARYQIADIAGTFPSITGPLVTAAMQDKDPYVRRRAFIALAASAPNLARREAPRFLSDPDELLPHLAATVLKEA